MDVLFLAFANSQNEPLSSLQKEDDKVYGLVSRRAMQQHFFLHRDSNATIPKVTEYLILYKDSISLFLYSGHAGRDALLIGDKKANSTGIAHLLSQCPQLKIVFLNGCSTEGQVKELLERGVPAVIATSAPINDRTATEFSISFFQSLSEGRSTLGEAFEAALGAAMVINGEIQVHRDFVIEDFEELDGEEKPIWGMFTNDKHPDVLQWKLPESPTTFQADFKPNELLISELVEALADFSPEAGKIMDDESMGAERSILDKRAAILTCLPHPISEQLRKLLVEESSIQGGVFYDKPGKPRLKQMVVTYNTIIELMAYVMFSQLWEIINEKDGFALPDELKEEFRAFFKLGPEERINFNFLPLLNTMRDEIKGDDFSWFIHEIQEDFFGDTTEFALACTFMETAKKRVNSKSLTDNEAAQLCFTAEEKLAKVVGKLGFLAHYTLTSIKDISFIKYRHLKEPKYKHKMVKLEQRFVGLAEEQNIMDSFWESSSVLLIRKEGNSRFLNLSPFIIDENAFDDKAGIAKLRFFDRYESSSDAFSFKHVYKPDDLPLVVQKQVNYRMLKAQFDAFSQLVFNQKMKTI